MSARMRRWSCLAIAVAALVLAPHSVHGDPVVSRSVVGGGGTNVSGGGLAIRGTVGQALIGGSGDVTTVLCSGYWCVGGVYVLSAPGSDGGPELPKELVFGVPTPNPSRDDVAFSLAMPVAAPVRFDVFDVSGRRVASLRYPNLDAGYHRIEWRAGQAGGAGPGIYFARLAVGDRVTGMRRFVLVR